MDAERCAAYVAETLARCRAEAGRPRACHCTGACGGNPRDCAYLNGPPHTFEELVELAAAIAAAGGDPERARRLRAALA